MTFKPRLKALRAACDKFNAACQVGGHVRLKVDGCDTPHYTITTSEAKVHCGHSPVVWMEGISGCYLLSHVTPVTAAEWEEGMARQALFTTAAAPPNEDHAAIKESLSRHTSKLDAVFNDIASVIYEELGQECGPEPMDDMREALAELARLRSATAMSPTRPVKVHTMRKYPSDNKWVRELLYERAKFHRFGTDYEEFENGPGPFPIAIVELPDGTVITPRADMIQFLDVA